MRFASRPWGRTSWVLDRVHADGWHLLGALSSEPRGLAVRGLLRDRGELASERQLWIRPPDGHPQGDTLMMLMDRQLERFTTGGGDDSDVESHYLLERHGDIAAGADAFLGSVGPSIVLDITAFPKRFFFPLLRFILADPAKTDVLVTYTLPGCYAPEPLHQDVEAASYLPSFMPSVSDEDEDAPHVLAVAVGFESPGLIQVVEEDQGERVHYLFPFPAAPPFFKGTWDFLQEGMSITDNRRSSLEGVSSRDPGSTFEKLLKITNGGRRASILAPYGPKPVSLAMCLFALGPGRGSCSVRYAQPKYYNPQYSRGTAADSHGVVSFAYLIRLGGRDFYTT